MSQPRAPLPAKLIAGLLFRDLDAQRCALEALEEHFGALDLLTEPEAFTFTTYYDREMGPGLLRQTVAFLHLLPPDRLADAKLATNTMEQELARNRQRRVNIDPGLLSEERLVLATGKNYTHRIYLRDGVYADLTLIYQKGRYRALPWTYPDYQTPRLLHFFAVLRQKLIFQRHGRLPVHGVMLECDALPGGVTHASGG
jgi:hypothetical protein